MFSGDVSRRGLLVGAAAVGISPSLSAVSAQAATRACGGLAVAGAGYYDVNVYSRFAAAVGTRVTSALVSFDDVADMPATWRLEPFGRHRIAPQITWGPQRATLRDIAAGRWDTHIATVARWMAGANAEIRFGHEMNGSPRWCAWGQQPTAFVAAWKRARSVFRENGNYSPWVWSPNVTEPGDHRSALHLYYPGDDHCEYVGLDGYSYPLEGNRPFAEIFAKDFRVLSKLSRRPMMVCETGVSIKSPRREAWITDMFRWLSDHPEVIRLTWWDRNGYQISGSNSVMRAFSTGSRRWLRSAA